MGYLSFIFNKHYHSDDNDERAMLREDFKKRIWNSVPYKKYIRHFKFRVVKKHIEDEGLYNKILQYSDIEYLVLKSSYSHKDIECEDMVRARINSNYAKYFDNEVFLDREYYKHLAHVKNIYMEWLKKDCSFDVVARFDDTLKKAEEFRLLSINKKLSATWEQYQEHINECIDKMFKNYKPYYLNNDFVTNDYNDWNDDNYIVGYMCRSFNLYIFRFIKNKDKPKFKHICEVCGIELKDVNGNRKYCDICRIEKRKERMRKGAKKFREKNKLKKHIPFNG